jgi:hypothetical protein
MGRVEKTVFVSYRRTDESWALAIFQDLTQHGYDVFIDYDGIASGSFETAILENIKARAHFLVLLTPTALERCGDPKDWMRREIEAALDSQRNIVPLMLAGFDFGTPATASRLTGKLSALKEYNGLEIPKGYFSPAMERLRNKFLSVSLDTVLHPASLSAQQAATEQKDKATMALGEALRQPGLSPDRKQEETAAHHLAEHERRRQEAEIKQRADEEERPRKAEAEKRRRDEEEHRLQQGVTRFDNTTLRLAEAEAQTAKPWLLSLIGAGAKSAKGRIVAISVLAILIVGFSWFVWRSSDHTLPTASTAPFGRGGPPPSLCDVLPNEESCLIQNRKK